MTADGATRRGRSHSRRRCADIIDEEPIPSAPDTDFTPPVFDPNSIPSALVFLYFSPETRQTLPSYVSASRSEPTASLKLQLSDAIKEGELVKINHLIDTCDMTTLSEVDKCAILSEAIFTYHYKVIICLLQTKDFYDISHKLCLSSLPSELCDEFSDILKIISKQSPFCSFEQVQKIDLAKYSEKEVNSPKCG